MSTRDGIDVSHYQNAAGGGGANSIRWDKVLNDGAKYVIVKISEKTTPDNFAVSNVTKARAAGLFVGGYHFFRNTASGTDQAHAFLNTITYQPGDMVPSLDIELVPNTTAAKQAYVAKAREWVSTVRGAYGRWPFIYTRKNIWQQLGNPSGFGNCPLWLARYSSSPPQIPSGWSSYVIWQFSQTGSINGITGAVDEDSLAIPYGAFHSGFKL